MTIFEELRKGVIDSHVSLADVLRRAKLFASYLGNAQFKEWVDHELNGYPQEIDLPPYRVLRAASLGTFSGPFGNQVSNYVLPTFHLPPGLKDLAEHVPFWHGVKELEGMVKNERDLRRPWPAEAVMVARDDIKLSGRYILIEAHQPITKPSLEGILDAVRNKLLDFLLELQELDPSIIKSEDALPTLKQEQVGQVFNITIQGDHNVLASGTEISQNVTKGIDAGDIDQLMGHLSRLGIGEKDLTDLKASIEADERPQAQDFGPRVRQWIGTMTVKAAQGVWKTALASAPTLITSALSNYYGWK